MLVDVIEPVLPLALYGTDGVKVPTILGSPAVFTVPAVVEPSTNLSIRFGNAKVVLPSPDP